MNIVKIPRMKKNEYDRLINEEFVGRITFKGNDYPYIAPFLYVFDGKFIYFLSTRYGKKIQYFKHNPNVSVEIERYDRNFSNYEFVILSGRIVEVQDLNEKEAILEKFIYLIKNRNLSKNVMVVFGHLPEDPVEIIGKSERLLLWKLIEVKNITGLAYQ
jgi:nitroimidazol reductase NimA-like FMN-containing flavoprotein (pyridoxamine 5'-phosphate oxidase superfamily)